MEITIERLVNELKDVLPEDQVVINKTVRELHSKDESYHNSSLPDVVVFPKTMEEVRAIMKVASEHKKPVIPFGVGSSLEGHIIPYERGLQLIFH